jgi:hypothetical protein
MNGLRTIVLLSFCAAALVTAGTAGSAPPQPVPPNFHVVAPGSVGFAFEPFPCGGFRITGLAPASGTEIGDNGTLAATECSRPDGAVNHVDGQAVVTATGGDQIFIHYFGDSPPADSNGVFHEELSFTITGGTGHFEGSTGGGRLTTDGVINFFGPTIATAHYDGTIEHRGPR